MFDKNGYPDEEALKAIATFDFGDKFLNLPSYLKLIRALWHWDDYFRYNENTGCLELHTGGWSGNESIISALQDHKYFWWVFWYKSKRGGHYWFEIYQWEPDGKIRKIPKITQNGNSTKENE